MGHGVLPSLGSCGSARGRRAARRQRLEIRQLTPEQFRRMRALEDRSRDKIRDLLTDAQKGEYDKLKNRR